MRRRRPATSRGRSREIRPAWTSCPRRAARPSSDAPVSCTCQPPSLIGVTSFSAVSRWAQPSKWNTGVGPVGLNIWLSVRYGVGGGPGSNLLRGSTVETAAGAVTEAGVVRVFVSVPVNRRASRTGVERVCGRPRSSSSSSQRRVLTLACSQAITPFWIRPPSTLGGQSMTSTERTETT